MKKTWEHKKLGEVITLEYGKPLLPDQRKSDGKYPVYGANGIKDRTDGYFYDKPSIIIGRKGSAGEINLTEEKFWPLDVTYYVVYDQKKYDRKFLFYLLRNLQLQKLAKGVKPGINRNDVYAIKVDIPPLPEQQRIVDILDQSFAAIDQAIENTEKNLENTKLVFSNYLQSIFSKKNHGWKEQKISDVALIKGGKRVPKGYKLRTSPTKHPYIRVTDFNDYGSVNLEDIHYIDDQIFEQIKRYTISTNDLYISIAGTIGKSGIIPKELDGANLTENACKLEFKTSINPKFIYYFTKSNLFLDQAGLNTRTAAMPKLALSRLGTIKLSLPLDLQEQNNYVEKIDEISKYIQKLQIYYNQKIEKLQELKQSIIHKAFTGEL